MSFRFFDVEGMKHYRVAENASLDLRDYARAVEEFDKAIARENLRINRQLFGWHGINWAPELASHLFRALFKSDDDAKTAKPRARFDYLDRERDDDSTCDGECPCCAGCSDCGSCY